MVFCGSRLAGDGVGSITDAIASASHSIATKAAPTGTIPALFETLLPPRLIHRYRHGIGQIQTATALAHGQAQALLAGQRVENLRWQAPALWPENKRIAILIA